MKIKNPSEHPDVRVTIKTEVVGSVDGIGNSVDVFVDGQYKGGDKTEIKDDLVAVTAYGSVVSAKAPTWAASALKLVDGGQGETPAGAFTFSLVQVDESGNPIEGGQSAEAVNGADGAISFDAIRKAKAEGLPITCETAPHYIALNDEALLKYGTLAKMNPPLRSEADRQATIAAVADGTVDLLATDHAPHTMEEKELGFLDAPNGIIGLECAYGVCHKILVDGGFISDERLIELMSTGPAELMGHDKTDITAVLDDYADAVPGDDDTKRVLDLGRVPESDQVDLVVLNTGEEWTVDPEKFHSSARNTPFGGWQVTGRPLATIIGSKLAFSRIDKED